MTLLRPELFRHYIDEFNSMEPEDIVNLIPNAQAWSWISSNVPLFSCPDSLIEKIYYYRWWTFRKHVKQTPAGIIITEFISDVRHAGTYNSISCALGHHLGEGRWIRDRRILDEYTRFWYRGIDAKPEPKFHKYSQWVMSAIWDRYLVSGDPSVMLELHDDLRADYALWETEKQLPNGLFWQFDVWDGMEESISGSRKHRNARPTINSYMFGNSIAMAEISKLAGRDEHVATYLKKAATLRQHVHDHLWDESARFFKAQTEETRLSDAREAIGFIPWCFHLPERGLEDAWKQLTDPEGFWAPMGITTAERRHPKFRSHGVGKCEWDGAVWPFATSQTLNAMANVLRNYEQSYVTKQHYLEAMQTYAKAHHKDGKPYIGEYHDEVTGEWLKGDNPRSRWYNHSTFCDLVISGLVGLVPRRDSTVEVHPLLPENAWDWFCLEHIRYHGRELSVLWDRTGEKFGNGAGLSLFCNGQRIGHSNRLARLKANLP
jgi:hypothetical protein